MKLKRSRQSKKGRIEIIPMIDVMFFLLATFMLASLSMQRLDGLVVNLPHGKSEKISTENRITLTINHENLIFVNKEKVAIKGLESRLRDELVNTDKTIIVLSDEHAFQGTVTEAMLAARKAGAEKFSIMVREE